MMLNLWVIAALLFGSSPSGVLATDHASSLSDHCAHADSAIARGRVTRHKAEQLPAVPTSRFDEPPHLAATDVCNLLVSLARPQLRSGPFSARAPPPSA